MLQKNDIKKVLKILGYFIKDGSVDTWEKKYSLNTEQIKSFFAKEVLGICYN